MSEKITGHLYLIPSALGEEGTGSIPESTRGVLHNIQFFLVENERSARRFLRSIGYKKDFDEGFMIVVARDEDFIPPQSMLQHLLEGNHIAVISEAGCPGIADPGAAAVLWAHAHNIKVIPMIGPSSIFLALMASGLNGQQFAFHGYLPVNAAERKVKLKQLEEESLRKNQTQIFMETPYRNISLLKDVMESCRPQTLLCIACDITLPSEKILTQRIHDWKKQLPDINKRPTIFLILAKQ